LHLRRKPLQVIAQCFLFDEPQLICQQKQGEHEENGTPKNRLHGISLETMLSDSFNA